MNKFDKIFKTLLDNCNQKYGKTVMVIALIIHFKTTEKQLQLLGYNKKYYDFWKNKSKKENKSIKTLWKEYLDFTMNRDPFNMIGEKKFI